MTDQPPPSGQADAPTGTSAGAGSGTSAGAGASAGMGAGTDAEQCADAGRIAVPLERAAPRQTLLARVPLLRLLRGTASKWTRPDGIALLAVVATVATATMTSCVALATNEIAADNLEVDRQAQVMRADVAVVAAEAYLGDEIEAQKTSDTRTETVRIRPATIDLTFQNSGNAPQLVEEVRLDFDEVTTLDSCMYSLGGPVEVRGTFTFTVGLDAKSAVDTSAHYKVPPNDIERVAVTVGPETIGEAAGPWIAVARVSFLLHGRAEPLQAGYFALVSPPFGGWALLDAADGSWRLTDDATVNQSLCLTAVREKLAALADRPGIIASAEFTQLRESLAAHRPTVSAEASDYPELVAGACTTGDAVNPEPAPCDPGRFEIVRRVPFTADPAECDGTAAPVETGDFTTRFTLCLDPV